MDRQQHSDERVEPDDTGRARPPGRTDAADQDPGHALVELLASLGDALSYYADQIANESHLGSPRRNYVVSVREDGATVIQFGDGEHVRRPPPGGSVRVQYRRGHRYASVQLQEGRVILDEDWNEAPPPPLTCGIYRAVVVDAADPLGKERLRVEIPEVTGAESRWAVSCTPA
jgi:hypothetical protein